MSEFVKKQKTLYKSLQPCFCPALQEIVHFTSDGLNHLLYYQRRPRNPSERHYRASLISHLMEVIEKATQAIQVVQSTDPLVITWSLEHHVARQGMVKVILKREGTGRIKFLSAMAKKRTKKPRT